MIEIFNWFGGILGYLLWALFTVFKNYGVAIALFTLILKLVLFPFSIKQQKSMAATTKVQGKIKELQKKYATDKAKLNEETQKLYQKEGISPTGGCLPMLLPLPIMMGIYYSVMNPIQNVLHFGTDAINKAIGILQKVPGIGGQFQGTWGMEIQIIKHFDSLRPHLEGIFTDGQLDQIGELSRGFGFLGLDLLATPQQSSFASMMWLIPALCLLTSWLSQFFMMKLQPGMNQQQGCMKWMLYLMPLMSAWFALTMPGAVGFYYTLQTVIGFAQTIVMNRFYSPADLTARGEAGRISRRVLEEERMQPLSLADQELLRVKLYPRGVLPPTAAKKELPEGATAESAQQKPVAKPKNKGKPSQKSDNYRGSKK